MITKQELYYDSRNQGSKIHAIKWIPEKEIKCALILAHGMAEHIERYDEFATYMAERGILVAGNSHLGHGKSVGENELRGYFCPQDPATVVVRDVHRLKKLVQQEHPGIPYLVLGHSMGSYLIRNYLCRYGTGVVGAILVGTGMPPVGLTAVARLLAGIQAFFRRGKRPGKMLNKLAFGGYNKKFSASPSSFAWISANTENLRAYEDDPWCGFLFTVNGFQTLFELIYRIQRPRNLRNMPADLPILFVSGSQDPVGDYGKGVKRAKQSLQAIGMKDLTVQMYPAARHEILQEKEKEAVCEEILAWITGKISKLSKTTQGE